MPEAQAALAAAAEKAPQDPHTWYALGLLYRGENDPHKALEAFEKVLALDARGRRYALPGRVDRPGVE